MLINKLRPKILTVIFAAFFTLTGCDSTSTSNTGTIEKITLAAETSLLTATVWVAEAEGYFIEEGLDITIKPLDSGRNCLEQMLTGTEINIATVAQTPVVFSSFKSQDFVIFATMAYSKDDTTVLARTDRGISTPKDLIGKKIGTPLRSTGHYFLDGFLEHYNIKINQVNLVDDNASKLTSALLKGKVDAITIWQPHIYNSKKELKDKTVSFLSPTPFRKEFYFTVKKDFAKAKPEVVEKFLRAVVKAEQFIQDHPQQTKQIVISRLGFDKELVDEIWDKFVFEISLDQAIFTVLESEASWALKNAFVSGKEPNYLYYVDSNFLRKVKPYSVTVSQ